MGDRVTPGFLRHGGPSSPGEISRIKQRRRGGRKKGVAPRYTASRKHRGEQSIYHCHTGSGGDQMEKPLKVC